MTPDNRVNQISLIPTPDNLANNVGAKPNVYVSPIEKKSLTHAKSNSFSTPSPALIQKSTIQKDVPRKFVSHDKYDNRTNKLKRKQSDIDQSPSLVDGMDIGATPERKSLNFATPEQKEHSIAKSVGPRQSGALSSELLEDKSGKTSLGVSEKRSRIKLNQSHGYDSQTNKNAIKKKRISIRQRQHISRSAENEPVNDETGKMQVVDTAENGRSRDDGEFGDQRDA